MAYSYLLKWYNCLDPQWLLKRGVKMNTKLLVSSFLAVILVCMSGIACGGSASDEVEKGLNITIYY